LARSPEEIRLSEILAAVDGPITIGDFGEPHQDGSCDHEGQCVLYAIWQLAGGHMRRLLEGYTLANVAEVAQGKSAWPEPYPS
jgi:Rrf2 family iron-sulfur cluster assembly transcriptional regulator